MGIREKILPQGFKESFVGISHASRDLKVFHSKEDKITQRMIVKFDERETITMKLEGAEHVARDSVNEMKDPVTCKAEIP
jgi:hypothetical protein